MVEQLRQALSTLDKFVRGVGVDPFPVKGNAATAVLARQSRRDLYITKLAREHRRDDFRNRPGVCRAQQMTRICIGYRRRQRTLERGLRYTHTSAVVAMQLHFDLEGISEQA